MINRPPLFPHDNPTLLFRGVFTRFDIWVYAHKLAWKPASTRMSSKTMLHHVWHCYVNGKWPLQMHDWCAQENSNPTHVTFKWIVPELVDENRLHNLPLQTRTLKTFSMKYAFLVLPLMFQRLATAGGLLSSSLIPFQICSCLSALLYLSLRFSLHFLFSALLLHSPSLLWNTVEQQELCSLFFFSWTVYEKPVSRKWCDERLCHSSVYSGGQSVRESFHGHHAPASPPTSPSLLQTGGGEELSCYGACQP